MSSTSNTHNMRAGSRLVRQDSVDDFLAQQRIPQESIRQFMDDTNLASHRPTTTSTFDNNIASIHTSATTPAHRSHLFMSKLKRQDSVDDFLANDFARTRSVAEYIQLIGDPKLDDAKPSSDHKNQTPAKLLQSSCGYSIVNSATAGDFEATSGCAPPQCTLHSPSEASKAPTKRSRRQMPASHAADMSEEEREERRREQNREAQRRFRERRRYQEFEAFSHRLSVAAPTAAAPASMAATRQPTPTRAPRLSESSEPPFCWAITRP